MSDWRNDHERDPLSFEDEEQALARGEGEGVRVLGPDESTRPTPRPVPRRGQRAVDDSEEFWGERATDFELEGDSTWSASSQGLTESETETESESKPRSRRGKRAARRAKTATPPPESRGLAVLVAGFLVLGALRFPPPWPQKHARITPAAAMAGNDSPPSFSLHTFSSFTPAVTPG